MLVLNQNGVVLNLFNTGRGGYFALCAGPIVQNGGHFLECDVIVSRFLSYPLGL
jgi:hypothetical protein